ncbi:PilN domain-containing protein [Peredibacter starrii]|uniref:PilN domain-containing protein n=1 Tax=Peredibacter starrii TaxID=28202 RepID=A0AAX4HQP1_9BACT|nr:PilN domain-containing protein [Peredibacter starrii]WPU65537.1 PilN domain-containing protein [Peredibacter starrii]
MIKINLSNEKKQVDLANVGGFDFSKVKIKPLLLVMVLVYLPDVLLAPILEEQKEAANQELSTKQAKLNSLKRKVAASKDMDKQIKELKAQEENLGKKLLAVKQAISEKRNPSNILLYIAKNIPAELWIKSLTIDQDKMTIKGEALDYTSIGNFVNSLRSSIFIKDANISETNSTVRADKRRIETFEVVFGIARFDQ